MPRDLAKTRKYGAERDPQIVMGMFDDEQWLIIENFIMSLWVTKCLEMEQVQYLIYCLFEYSCKLILLSVNMAQHINRLVVIFQETARNHFWEAGMLMQSYMLETVQ